MNNPIEQMKRMANNLIRISYKWPDNIKVNVNKFLVKKKRTPIKMNSIQVEEEKICRQTILRANLFIVDERIRKNVLFFFTFFSSI